jgi:hypothetical protein
MREQLPTFHDSVMTVHAAAERVMRLYPIRHPAADCESDIGLLQRE